MRIRIKFWTDREIRAAFDKRGRPSENLIREANN